MNHRFRIAALVILIAAAGTGLLPAQTPARFFDTAEAPAGKVRLTVFFPSVGTLKALLALREQGLIPVSNLEIVGVHHRKEKTNYAESENFVRDNKLDWIKFHTVSADLGPETIFKKNAASAELETIFSLSSGVIFFGGPDIVPSLRRKDGVADGHRGPLAPLSRAVRRLPSLGRFPGLLPFKGYLETTAGVRRPGHLPGNARPSTSGRAEP